MSEKETAMPNIKVEPAVTPERLSELGVARWPVWGKEVSTFPWSYDSTETCYFLEGRVTVTPDGGEPVTMGKGDLAVFPAGMSCTWEIHAALKKHYQFS
jgi:uncharacterized cupin superfamily protein